MFQLDKQVVPSFVTWSSALLVWSQFWTEQTTNAGCDAVAVHFVVIELQHKRSVLHGSEHAEVCQFFQDVSWNIVLQYSRWEPMAAQAIYVLFLLHMKLWPFIYLNPERVSVLCQLTWKVIGCIVVFVYVWLRVHVSDCLDFAYIVCTFALCYEYWLTL